MPLSIRPLTSQKVLSAILIVDGLILLGFGIASWLAPYSTFGTLVDLSGAEDHSLVVAILSSLSIFYVLIGLACFLAAVLAPPHKDRFAALMVIGHVFTGLKGYGEVGREWLVGSPWPDIVIHSVFVCAYSLLAFITWRGSQTNGNGSA